MGRRERNKTRCHSCRRHPGVGGQDDGTSQTSWISLPPLGRKHQRVRPGDGLCHAMRNSLTMLILRRGRTFTSRQRLLLLIPPAEEAKVYRDGLGRGISKRFNTEPHAMCECERDSSKIRSCPGLEASSGSRSVSRRQMSLTAFGFGQEHTEPFLPSR